MTRAVLGRAGTFSMTAAMLARTALQVALFLALAGALGASGYGRFTAILAIFAFANPLVASGPAFVLSQALVRQERSPAESGGTGLLAVGLGGTAVLIASTLVASRVLPDDIPAWAIACVGLSELLFYPLVELCGRLFQALGRPVLLPGLVGLLSGTRLVVFAAWALTSRAAGVPLTAAAWAFWYAAASGACALACVILFVRGRGLVAPSLRVTRDVVRSGIPVAASASALRAHAELDKVLMARLAGSAETGFYSLAARLVDMAVLPAQAHFEATLPQFFKEGARGARAVWQLARAQGRFVLLLSVAGAIAMVLVAPYAPRVVGHSYDGAIPVFRALCLLPAVAVIRLLLRQSLLTAGASRACALLEMVAVGVNVAANLCLIPAWGWLGAVISAYASGAVAIMGSLMVMRARLR